MATSRHSVSTNAKLRKLMQRYELTAVAVGKLLKIPLLRDPRRPGTFECPTVKSWASNPASKRFRVMPAHRLKELQEKLRRKQ